MRRTTSLPRSLWRLLLVGLCLTLGAGAAVAQENVPVLVIPINTTKKVEMSKKQKIMEVRNENPKICRVQPLMDTPNAVLITGIGPGTSRVIFTDENKMTETVDVVVTTEDRVIREQQRKEFLEQIAKTVPGARIDVLIGDKSTIIIGTAPDANSRGIIGQTANNTFGGGVVNAVTLPGQEGVVNVPRVQQVELEVLVALVNRSEARKLSFDWVVNRGKYSIASTLNSPLSFVNVIGVATQGFAQGITGKGSVGGAEVQQGSTTSLNFGVVGDKGSFSAFLDALRTEGIAKVLSEPRITTLSGQEASIVSGGETPIVLSSGVGAPPTVSYKSFGTTVKFTPLVLENGRIQLKIMAELSALDGSAALNVQGVNAPGFATRRAESVVHIEDCQTLAIGGLIQSTIAGTIKKIPFLGDIPFLGTAFSSTNYKETEEEMVILVTPRLVDPMNCTQIPRRLPGRETRSPDDFELFLTQILEAPRGQREVWPDGRFRAAHRNGPTASIYPCGDNSQPFGWNRGCATGNCGTGSSGHAVLGNNANLAPTQPSATTPAGAPASLPDAPASLPAPEAPAAPPIPSDFPATETRPNVPGALGPVGGGDPSR